MKTGKSYFGLSWLLRSVWARWSGQCYKPVGKTETTQHKGHMTKVHQQLVAALLPLAIDNAVNFRANGYKAGTIAVVVTGKERHKRVIGKGYLLAEGGSAPVPLGICGDASGRAFYPAEIRPATGKEIVKTLRNLNPAQIKTLVCTLSGNAAFRETLRGVIDNPEGCDCD